MCHQLVPVMCLWAGFLSLGDKGKALERRDRRVFNLGCWCSGRDVLKQNLKIFYRLGVMLLSPTPFLETGRILPCSTG